MGQTRVWHEPMVAHVRHTDFITIFVTTCTCLCTCRSLSLSLLLERKRASSTRPLLCPRSSAIDEQFCNLLTFERSLTLRVSLFAILALQGVAKSYVLDLRYEIERFRSHLESYLHLCLNDIYLFNFRIQWYFWIIGIFEFLLKKDNEKKLVKLFDKNIVA